MKLSPLFIYLFMFEVSHKKKLVTVRKILCSHFFCQCQYIYIFLLKLYADMRKTLLEVSRSPDDTQLIVSFSLVIVTATDFIWTSHTISIAVWNSSRFLLLLF